MAPFIDRATMKLFARGGTIGFYLVIATFVGLAIGYWLDGVFSTRPWLTIIFLLLGIVSGFREIFRMVRKEADQADSGSKNGSDTKDI